MFPISSGFPLPWTTNPQRLNFFSLFSLASSSSWKKTPKVRSTLAIPEWKHCTANKTNNHPRMSILHHAKHDTGFCRQSAVFMSPVPQLSIAQQGLLRPFGCAPSLQPSSPWTFFFSLCFFLFSSHANHQFLVGSNPFWSTGLPWGTPGPSTCPRSPHRWLAQSCNQQPQLNILAIRCKTPEVKAARAVLGAPCRAFMEPAAVLFSGLMFGK